MSKDNKRYSILKKPHNESSPTATFSKADRRISFSRKNSIKEFMAGDDKATIWGTSYEESASSKDTISISDTQPNISEPRIVLPTKIPHRNIGMVLRNRKVTAVPNRKKIQVVEEEKENVNILPETKFHSNDINNSDMDLSGGDWSAGIEIKNSENIKLKEHFDSVPITSIEPSCSENTLKSEISSPVINHNSTFNRTPIANWVLNNSLDITLSEDEKKLFLFKDKSNNDHQSHSPLKKNNGSENSQGVTKKGICSKATSPLKEYNVATENTQGAIRKVIDKNTSSKNEEIKTSLQEDSNEEFFDYMDTPAEILADTGKNIRKTIYWNETIQDKTELMEKSRFEQKSVKKKIRHTILVDEEMEIQDNTELTGTSKIGPKSDKKKVRHTMFVDEEMEIQDKTDLPEKIRIGQKSDKKKSRHTMLVDEEMEIQDKTELMEKSRIGPKSDNKNSRHTMLLDDAMEIQDYIALSEKNRIATKSDKKKIRHTMLVDDDMEIQDKTELTEKSKIGLKPDKTKIRHTIFVNDEMEIQDKFELTEKHKINSKSDKKPSRHTILVDKVMEIDNKTELTEKSRISTKLDKNNDDEMKMSFGNKEQIPLFNNKDILDSRQNENIGLKDIIDTSNLDLTFDDQNLVSVEKHLRNTESYMELEEEIASSIKNKDKNQPITLLDISEIQNNISHKNHLDVKRKQTIYFEKDESSALQTMPYPVSNVTTESFQNENILREISMELEDTSKCTESFQNENILREISMELEDTNILKSTPSSERFESPLHTIFKNKTNIVDVEQNAKQNLSNQQESIIYDKEESAYSAYVSNNVSLSESFMILDSNGKKNLLNDKTTFIKPINTVSENRRINKSAIKERHTVFKKTIEMSMPTNNNDIDNSFNSEREVGLNIKRKTIMFQNNDIELENLSQSRIKIVSMNRHESEPKLHTVFSQNNDDMDVTNMSEQQSQHAFNAEKSEEIQKAPQKILQKPKPKRHTIFNQKNTDMDVTNISQAHPHHPVTIDSKGIKKNRQTIIFQENIELDTTNLINNEKLRIQSVSMNRNESEPKRHTVFHQENNDMDVTSISEERSQHAFNKEKNVGIQKDPQTILQKPELKRHTIFNQINTDMDVTNISQAYPHHPVTVDSKGIKKNRQTIMFQENNELDTTNINNNECLLPPIQSVSMNRNESEPKRHTIFSQNNDDMDVTNITQAHPHHPVTVDSKGIKKNRQTIIFQENNELDTTNLINNENLRIQSVSMNRNESEPKRHTVFHQENNDIDVTSISEERSQHAFNKEKNVGIQEDPQTILQKPEPKQHTIFNQINTDMDVTNISQAHPHHPVTVDSKGIKKNRQTIMFQENNELDTTNINNNECLLPPIQSVSMNRNETEPKRHTIFSQKNDDMDVTNISQAYLIHPVTVASKRINKNRQTIMFQENNDLDTTNIVDNKHLHSLIQSVSINSKESRPKHNIFNHRNNDMDVTNISQEPPPHYIPDSREIQKNRKTIMFQENNELDTTNISYNEPKHHTIFNQENDDMDVTSTSEEHSQDAFIADKSEGIQKDLQTILQKSEPKRHTILNQKNTDMDVTNISQAHSHHPVTVDSKAIKKNRQTIMFQENNEFDTTNIIDNEDLHSRIQSVSMNQNKSEPQRHTIFYQENNDMDVTNISQKHPQNDFIADSRGIHKNRQTILQKLESELHTISNQQNNDMNVRYIAEEHNQHPVIADSRRIQKNRQTIMFQENNELDTTNIRDNAYLHSRIQSVSMNRKESETKRHTIVNQKNDDMDVTNISQENPQHPPAIARGINKNRQTIMFQENNELDITNSSNNEYLQISRPYQKPQNPNEELDITNNQEDKIIQHPVYEKEKFRSENFLKRKTLFFDENIDIDDELDFYAGAAHSSLGKILNPDSKSQSLSCSPNQTQNLSIDYTEVINTLRPRKFLQNQIQRIDKSIRIDLSDCEPSPKGNVRTLANLSQDRPRSLVMDPNKSEQKHHTTNSKSEEREKHFMVADMEEVGLQVNRQTNLFQNNAIELDNLSQYHNESEPKRNTIFFHKNNDMDVTNISQKHPQHTVIADKLERKPKNCRTTVFENNDLDITKMDEEQEIKNKCKKNASNKRQTVLFQENNELDTTNIIEESEHKHHIIFNQKNDDMDVTNISQEHPQHPSIADIRGIQNNRQTIMFQENNELDTTNSIGNEYVTSSIQSFCMNRKESESIPHTIVNQKNDDMDVTNISQEHSQHAVIADSRRIQKDRQTILQKSESKRHTIFNQKNNDMDVTNVSQEHPQHPVMADIRGIQKNRQTIMSQENIELDTTNIVDTQRKTIVFQNEEIDLTNNREDITNKTVNRSITKNDIENLVSNQYLKRKMTFPDQTNDLDLDDVPKKANNSSDNYDHKPDLVSNRNMELTNISSQDYAFDINYNNSNISIKLSTPVKNPNNTKISVEKTPPHTVLSTENNDLNIGDLTLNIGMKEMDNTTQSHQNKSDIDFTIVYSPRRTSSFKIESNKSKESSENSIRKTIIFDCDNDFSIANKSIEELPLRTMTSRDLMDLYKINQSTSETKSSQEFTPNSRGDISRNATSGKSCHTSTKLKPSQEYKLNCTGHLCRNADITKLTEEEKNVSKVFDKIRKSFGLRLSLDDDIENTRFNLVNDSAITVNGSLTEYLINEKYQMNEVPILNQSNDKKPNLEQSYCIKCKKNIDPNETSLHGFTLDDNPNKELRLDFNGYEKFNDMPTMLEIMDYYKKKRQELYDWYNSQIDAINTQESRLLLKTSSLKLLDQNYRDELYKKVQSETKPDEIEPIFPLIPSVEFLLKNKFKYEKLDWKMNDIHLPAGILEVRHKYIRTFCLQFLFKKTNYAETTESSIHFDKVLFKECPFYENWTARDLFIHNELSLKIPTNLTPSCSSSPHLFNFLEYINKICKNVMLLTRELMLILIDTHASLEKDESDQCFIRKLVRKNLSTSQEIFIRINDSAKLSHSNVGLRPGPLCFNDNIQSLPVGLQFVQQFLKEPSKFMKLF